MHGVHPERVSAIPLAQDAKFQPLAPAEVERFRAKAGLPARFLLSVGTLEPRKNLTTLLQAYARVRDQLAGIPLVLVGGKGWGYDVLFEQIKSLGLEDRVRLTGFVAPEDLPFYYAAATAFVYPSLYEGFGLPPLEAMGVGTPVITSNAGSLREVAGDAAIAVDALDVAGLAEALVRVVTEESLRDELRRRGFQRAERFSWQRVADQTLDLLQAVGGHPTVSAWSRDSIDRRSGSYGSAHRLVPAVPRRVLYVGHTSKLGGAEIALWQLLRNLNRKQVEPTVLLFSEGPLCERLKRDGISVRVISLPRSVLDASKDALGLATLSRIDDMAAAVLHVLRVARYISRGGFEIVHTNTLKAHVLAGFATRIAGRTLVWHIRERITTDYLPHPVAQALRRLSRMVPQAIIANSAATRLSLLEHDAQYKNGSSTAELRCSVIWDGTDVIRFRPTGIAGRDASCPARIGLIGRISPFKGQDVFLRAAAEVASTHADTRFIIVGSALFGERAYERELQGLVKQLGIADKVEFRGFRDNIAAELAALDIVVHASVRPEPFGQVIIEAMASGKPVIATKGGGVPEIICDRVTGYLVAMGDAGAMAAALRELLDNPDRAAAVGAAARDVVCEQFSILTTARHVEHFYETLLETTSFRGPPARVALPETTR